MERIKTGILGLDERINGGFIKNSVYVVVGGSGTGKTTFGLQYLLEGLRQGQDGLYITMEQTKESILKNAKAMGFGDLEKYVDQHLFFMETRGAEFEHWIKETLPKMLQKHKQTGHDYDVETRIVVDPLTSLLWEIQDKNKQRLVVTDLFDMIRTVGTCLVTVEQYGSSKEVELNEEVGVPIYLSDGAMNLVYFGFEGQYNRVIKVIKMRGSIHSEKVNSIYFVKGLGVVVLDESDRGADVVDEGLKYQDIFSKAIALVEGSDLKENERHTLLKRLEDAKSVWTIRTTPKEVIKELLGLYGISFNTKDTAIDF